MLTIEQLRNYGANVDDGLRRCMNNEGFYLMLVQKAIKEPSFEGLKAAVEAGDLEKGFEMAHALKGVMGNLALTPVCKPVEEITELLRNRTDADYSALVAEIISQRDRLVALMA
ncbi:MAG: Hpt domain-containing protein [Clostridia bacterium]|nr:Hpt domain-containing protein [Clostridia bacterium]